jgi:hypothetical protein
VDPLSLAVICFLAGAAILTGEKGDSLYETISGNRAVGGGGLHNREPRDHNQRNHRPRSVERAPESKPKSDFAERMRIAKEKKKNGRKVSRSDNPDDSGEHLPSESTGARSDNNAPVVTKPADGEEKTDA